MTISKQQAWAQFWQQGNASGCIQSQGHHAYGRPYEEYWQAYFARLSSDCTLLDVCTGNGAIAALATKFSRDNHCSFEVHGFDQVPVNAEVIKNSPLLQQVHFASNGTLENLPYARHCFHSIICQFGVEYTHLLHSLKEIGRVLRVGGNAAFVVHRENGKTTLAARQGLQFIRKLFEDIRYLDALRAFTVQFYKERQGEAPSQTLRNCNDELVTAKNKLSAYAHQSEAAPLVRDLINVTRHVLSHHGSLTIDHALEHIGAVAEAVEAHRLRLAMCQEAAVDDDGLATLISLAGNNGLQLVSQRAIKDDDGSLLASALEFTRQ
ncbi:class I SAM-dependent methyltransferase [Alteromonas sp. ASW11-19]|uniref:Class I SAM-dependent methyltransferase n=1 Tax=Alteromonas salexigens TaxID=2982530 RepID=A0ABT2VP45_9ALTE|nr:class I SAM-dependent methyltransferase [Alteromonas salexigens]MCU7555085.1 class I SAM-dependent methyltransferase [Alteromonas salexigens]